MSDRDKKVGLIMPPIYVLILKIWWRSVGYILR